MAARGTVSGKICPGPEQGEREISVYVVDGTKIYTGRELAKFPHEVGMVLTDIFRTIDNKMKKEQGEQDG